MTDTHSPLPWDELKQQPEGTYLVRLKPDAVTVFGGDQIDNDIHQEQEDEHWYVAVLVSLGGEIEIQVMGWDWSHDELDQAYNYDVTAWKPFDLKVQAVNERDQLIAALEAITKIAGNLPDTALEKGISNDAVHRGLMVITAREIALNALSKAQGSETTEVVKE